MRLRWLMLLLILWLGPASGEPPPGENWIRVDATHNGNIYLRRTAGGPWQQVSEHTAVNIPADPEQAPYDVKVVGDHHRVFWVWTGTRSKVWPKDFISVECSLEVDDERVRLAALGAAGLAVVTALLIGAGFWLWKRRQLQREREREQYVRSLEGHARDPRQLGPYRVKRLLGRGGTGKVFEVEDEYGDTYALKMPTFPEVLPLGESDEQEARERERERETRRRALELFEREYGILSRLTHPGIVKLRDYRPDCPDHEAFLVMELIHGETLETRLKKRVRLPVIEALPIARSLLEVLDYTHSAGVIHRDLKPGNVFLLKQGGLKVIDFGFSRDTNFALSQTGDLCGTPLYAAPEQIAPAQGQTVGPPVDVYAVGLVLYEMLTGVVPHAEHLPDLMKFALQRGRGGIAPAHQRNPQVDASVSQFVERLLMSDPSSRPSAAAALALLSEIPKAPRVGGARLQ